jgi:hypothetical protein
MQHVEFQLSKKYLRLGLKFNARYLAGEYLEIPSTPNPAYGSRYESSPCGKPYVAFIWKSAIRGNGDVAYGTIVSSHQIIVDVFSGCPNQEI